MKDIEAYIRSGARTCAAEARCCHHRKRSHPEAGPVGAGAHFHTLLDAEPEIEEVCGHAEVTSASRPITPGGGVTGTQGAGLAAASRGELPYFGGGIKSGGAILGLRAGPRRLGAPGV